MNSGRQVLGIATRHASVGIVCAILNISVIYVGTEILHAYYVFAMLATCVTTIPTAYLLHRHVSFRVPGKANFREFARFVGQQAIQFLVGFALLAIGVERLALNPTIAMVLVTLLLWMFALVLQWKYVFRVRGSSGRDWF